MRSYPPILALRLLVLSAVAACLLQTVPAAAAEDPEQLIREGVQLRRSGDDRTAQGYFQRAYDIAKTPRSAAQLGLVELALEMWQPAAQHLSEALGSQTDAWVQVKRTVLETALTNVRTHLGCLRLEGTPPGAHVRVAGVDRGALPLPGPVCVLPGSITIELEADGLAPSQRTVVLAAGQDQRVEMSLVRPTAAVAEPPAPAPATLVVASPPPASAPARWRPLAAWTTAGVAAALLVGGSVALIASNNNYDDFNNERIPGTNQFRCSKETVDTNGGSCKALLSAGDRDKTLAVVGFASAAVLAAASAYFFISSAERPKESTVSLTCGPSIAARPGALCAVTF
jgi:hypothetical protein